MNKKSRNNLLKYGITTFVAVLIASTVINLHGYDEAVTAADKYRILSDAFTIPGVVLMLCSLLVFVSNQGIFDGISTIFDTAGNILTIMIVLYFEMYMFC